MLIPAWHTPADTFRLRRSSGGNTDTMHAACRLKLRGSPRRDLARCATVRTTVTDLIFPPNAKGSIRATSEFDSIQNRLILYLPASLRPAFYVSVLRV